MGLLTDPITQFRTDLSESLAVREVLGIVPSGDVPTDVLAALAKIHIDGLPGPLKGTDALSGDELSDLRPYILIYPEESESLKIRITAMPRCIETGGTIIALISLPYTESEADDGPTAIWEAVAAKVDRLLFNDDAAEPGIIDYIGKEARMQIMQLDVALFGRTPLESRLDYGDAYDVVLNCRWGTE